jgi:hypothetical protein
MGKTGIFMGKGFHRRIGTGGLVMAERKRMGAGNDGVGWLRCLKKDISNVWD